MPTARIRLDPSRRSAPYWTATDGRRILVG
jgi:hypothetical protein